MRVLTAEDFIGPTGEQFRRSTSVMVLDAVPLEVRISLFYDPDDDDDDDDDDEGFPRVLHSEIRSSAAC